MRHMERDEERKKLYAAQRAGSRARRTGDTPGIKEYAASRRARAAAGFAALAHAVLLDILTRVSGRDAARAMGACRAFAAAARCIPEVELVLGKNYTCDSDDNDDDEPLEPAKPRGRVKKRRRGAAGGSPSTSLAAFLRLPGGPKLTALHLHVHAGKAWRMEGQTPRLLEALIAAPSPMANVIDLTLALERSATDSLIRSPRWHERQHLQRLLAACTSLRRLHLHFKHNPFRGDTLEYVWKKPGWWQDLLRSGAPGRKAAASARNCLRSAVNLERIDVSAAFCRMHAGEEFGPASEVPALAWLPDELSKPGLLIRRLAVPKHSAGWLEAECEMEMEIEADRAEYEAEEAEREAQEEEDYFSE